MNSRWLTWSPFESPTVREIKAHMTDDERAKYIAVSGKGGLFLGVALVLSTTLGILIGGLAWGMPLVMGAMVSVCVIFGLRMRRKVSELFCSTAWARLNHIEPNTLRLHRF